MTYRFELPSYRYSTLFVCLVFFFVVMPFFDQSPYAQFVTEIALLGMLAVFVYLVSNKPRIFWIATILAIPAILGTVGDILFQDYRLELTGIFGIFFFLGYVLWVFCVNLFKSKTVDTNMIYGAVCIYLLIAIECGLLYALLEIYVPNSFDIGTASAVVMSENNALVRDLVYYSFISLTTTGYGDIVPLTQTARYFSMLESFLGQMYLTVLVARLVGMHIAGRQK
ncbi:MAG: ion channel [Pseudomonadota bacterium]